MAPIFNQSNQPDSADKTFFFYPPTIGKLSHKFGKTWKKTDVDLVLSQSDTGSKTQRVKRPNGLDFQLIRFLKFLLKFIGPFPRNPQKK